jgi:hypothetical protein
MIGQRTRARPLIMSRPEQPLTPSEQHFYPVSEGRQAHLPDLRREHTSPAYCGRLSRSSSLLSRERLGGRLMAAAGSDSSRRSS